jgi:hypothetical protein
VSKKRYGNELHPLYVRWLSMTQRCTNPNHKRFKDWGGRGITIADGFKDFNQYAAYIEGLPNYSQSGTIDRIDNMKGYEPGNLRWTDSSTQISNQRYSGKGFNKYTGVNYSKTHNRWVARVTLKGRCLLSKVCLTEEEALEVRNKFITDNNLPHTVQKPSN